MGNNPVNFNDPSGNYACGDGYEDGCDPVPDKINIDIVITGNDEGGGEEEDDGTSLLDSYLTGWENFDQAWSIITNPNSTFGQRFLPSAYMVLWGGAHIGLTVGLFMLATQYVLLAQILNVGINVGVDALLTIASGNEYTLAQATETAIFSLLMGSITSGVTKALGGITARTFGKVMLWQGGIQMTGNTLKRTIIDGQPTTFFDLLLDAGSGVMATSFLSIDGANPNSLGHLAEASTALLTSLSPWTSPGAPVIIP